MPPRGIERKIESTTLSHRMSLTSMAPAFIRVLYMYLVLCMRQTHPPARPPHIYINLIQFNLISKLISRSEIYLHAAHALLQSSGIGARSRRCRVYFILKSAAPHEVGLRRV
jgi:hypothetical protein